MPQEVYFLRESGMGAIKIGVSRNLERRISSMRSNTPHEITVLGSVRVDWRFEGELQCRFAYARIRGEWFRPVEELLKYIEEITGFDLADLVVSSETPSS